MAIAFRRPFAVVFVILAGLFLSACGINTIPTYEQQAKAAWSEVLNQYQRRADLIPNLVETVKGYAKQEQTVLTRWSRRAPRRRRPRSPPMSSPIRRSSSSSRRRRASSAPRSAADRDHRELSRPEVQPELPGAAVAARGHREPHRGGPPRLHRGGAPLQHRARHLPRPLLGLDPLFEL